LCSTIIAVERTAASTRADIGTSRERIAAWAGVSVPTVVLFEVSPAGVKGSVKRRACARVYQILARTLEQLEQVKEAARGSEADDPGHERRRGDRRRSG
jgi:hypothetical protein